MACVHPLQLGSDATRNKRLVACGQCMPCRISRATEWAVRCLHERSGWLRSCFVTLTYNEEDVPRDFSLDKEEFTKFWKRLRKAAKRPLRYYACGEYGERNGRPHYHALIFGVAPYERELVEKAWGHGHCCGIHRSNFQCTLGSITMQSARYVADYVGKAVTGDRGREAYGGRTPPFAVMSLGIGRGFADKHRDQLLRQGVVTVGGKPAGMPRYYKVRLQREVQLLPDLWVSEGVGRPRVGGEGSLSRRQREKNVTARSTLRKKGVF